MQDVREFFNNANNNPYFYLYHWVKGEMYDIEAVSRALIAKEKMLSKAHKLAKKIKSTYEVLDKVEERKSNVKKSTGRLLSKIDVKDQEVQNIMSLHNCVTVYLGSQIVPAFKKKHLEVYTKILQQFSVLQIQNYHKSAEFLNLLRSTQGMQEGL